MIVNLDIFNKKTVNINLSDNTVSEIYDIFRKHSIECNIENLKIFLELIVNAQIEDINFKLDYDMQLELTPTLVIEDVSSSLIYEMLQEIQMNCVIEDINISANLDIEIELSLNCVLEDINFSCEMVLVVLRNMGDTKTITMAQSKTMTLNNFYYKEI